MPLLLVDVDDTVLQCSVSLEYFCTGILKIDPVHPLKKFYDVGYCYGIDDATVSELLNGFWNSPLMGKLSPEPCAAEVLPRLHRRGYKLVAITACADDARTVERRTANLTEAFGFQWDAVHCVSHEPKTITLRKYEPSIWVEDNFKNAVLGVEAGHQSFLISKSYNEPFNHQHVTRVNNWYEIEKLL